ncbi:MAG: AAA family ATPase [Nitrososphaeria archaeon]|nr:AAA family ATPase [Nitrososphaeria archaeon]
MKTKKIFKPGGQQMLDVSYIPPQLPHREEQIKLLIDALTLISEVPSETFFPPLLYGPTGTGKTSSMKLAAEKIKKEVKRKMVLHYVHVPCSVFTKSYSVVQRISEEITSAPVRGLGGEELLSMVFGELETRDEYLLLVLDDVDELIKRDRGRLLFMVTRLEEGHGKRRLFPVFVMRNWRILNVTPPAVRSKITGLRIEFEPYTKEELVSIVKQRLKLAFQPDVVSSNAVRQISFNSAVLGGGDARYALALLHGSGFVALKTGSKKIGVEHIREAQQVFDRRVPHGVLDRVDRSSLVILMAVAKGFKDESDVHSFSIRKIYECYLDVSQKLEEKVGSRNEVADKIEEFIDSSILYRDDGRIVLPSISALDLYEKLVELVYK